MLCLCLTAYCRKNKYMTETSFASYFMRMLIATSTAILLCVLFEYYQLEVQRNVTH